MRETREIESASAAPLPQKAAVTTERIAVHSLPMGVLDIELPKLASDAMFVACMDGVYQVSAETGETQQLYSHESYASGVVFDWNRKVLISAGYDGQLIWYDWARRSVFRRVLAHRFWSWQLALSPDGKRLATVTGQYLAGDSKYAPAPEDEPCVKVYDAVTGQLQHSLSHLPSVHAVAFSPNSRYVAAGNLMGEIRVWDMTTGSLVASWTTASFTSWGIIKSHCYIGGIHALAFTPDGEHLIAAGMGPMRDPMAGNGRQLWQRYAWRDSTPTKIDETHEGESGEGLMETLCWSPTQDWFVMGGRQRGGDWNAAIFSGLDGRRIHHLSTGYRITCAQFTASGERLIVAGAKKQKPPSDGKYPPFGVVELFKLA